MKKNIIFALTAMAVCLAGMADSARGQDIVINATGEFTGDLTGDTFELTAVIPENATFDSVGGTLFGSTPTIFAPVSFLELIVTDTSGVTSGGASPTGNLGLGFSSGISSGAFILDQGFSFGTNIGFSGTDLQLVGSLFSGLPSNVNAGEVIELSDFDSIGGSSPTGVTFTIPNPISPKFEPTSLEVTNFSASVVAPAASVPEPSSIAFLGLASVAFVGRRRRR